MPPVAKWVWRWANATRRADEWPVRVINGSEDRLDGLPRTRQMCPSKRTRSVGSFLGRRSQQGRARQILNASARTPYRVFRLDQKFCRRHTRRGSIKQIAISRRRVLRRACLWHSLFGKAGAEGRKSLTRNRALTHKRGECSLRVSPTGRQAQPTRCDGYAISATVGEPCPA